MERLGLGLGLRLGLGLDTKVVGRAAVEYSWGMQDCRHIALRCIALQFVDVSAAQIGD